MHHLTTRRAVYLRYCKSSSQHKATCLSRVGEALRYRPFRYSLEFDETRDFGWPMQNRNPTKAHGQMKFLPMDVLKFAFESQDVSTYINYH